MERPLAALLTAKQVIDWVEPNAPSGITAQKVFIGADDVGLGFQVAVATANSKPTRPQLAAIYATRKGKRQVFCVVVTYGDKAYLYGPEEQSSIEELPVSQAARYMQSVLDEPDVISASERIAQLKHSHDSTQIAGFTNSGLFASCQIRENVPRRPDWQQKAKAAQPLLNLREFRLIEALGFHAKHDVNNSLVLTATNDAPRAIAVLMRDEESFDSESHFYQKSPVAFGLALAAKKNAPWLTLLRRDQIRLCPGRDGVGVGQKGQADTYSEIDLAAIDPDYAALSMCAWWLGWPLKAAPHPRYANRPKMRWRYESY